MELSEKEGIFEAGRNWQKGHDSPSPATLKMIDNITKKIEKWTNDIADIKIQNQKMSDDIGFIKEKFTALPCEKEKERIDEVVKFQTNLKAKIGIITTVCVFVGGFMMWLAQEIIKKAYFK